MTRHEVDPISRIEGHLGIKVEVSGGVITEANAHGNLWRGFENFLIGREANDAITFTQRICGVCPLPHATASMFAVESVLGVSDGYMTFEETGGKGVPAKAVLIRNIVYACEFLMSAITHFYHLAAPSYVQGPAIPPWTPYFQTDQYSGLLLSGGRALPDVDASGVPQDLWSAVIKQYVKALRIRRLTFEAGAIFAGRMPMVSSFVAGGVTNKVDDATTWTNKIAAFKTLMSEVADFVVTEYIPVAAALGFLYLPYDNAGNGGNGYGAGCKNLLAWGAFPATGTAASTAPAIKGGYYVDSLSEQVMFLETKADVTATGNGVDFVANNLVEFIARSNYQDALGEFDASGKAYPGDVSRTVPDRSGSATYFDSLDASNADGYSWLKAPRIKASDGDYYPMEVGPFARLNVNSLYFSTATDKGLFHNAGALTVYGGLYGKLTSDARGVGPVAPLTYVGLDPAMIHSDLATALVLEGLADVSSDGAIVDPTTTDGLISWIINIECGFSTMDRLRARAIEAYHILTYIMGADLTGNTSGWIFELTSLRTASGYTQYAVPSGTVSGMGVSEAPRGCLAHFVTAAGGKITKYQCVVPTTWNASPKDGATGSGRRGPMEEACVGTAFDASATVTVPGAGTAKSGVEVLRIAQSFDPCIACAVH